YREKQLASELEVAELLPETLEIDNNNNSNNKNNRRHQHSHHRSHSRSQSRLLQSRHVTSPDIFAAASGDENHLEDGLIPRDLEHTEANTSLMQRNRSRKLTTTSDIGHRRTTSMVLFGLTLLTMKQTLPALQDHSGSRHYGLNNGGPISGRVFARAIDGDQGGMGAVFTDNPTNDPPDQNIVQLGRIFAWVCTVFYLSSRMPQLWKNFKRKSVQGLSILMFFWAAMGNLSYTLSILNSSAAVNPETRRKFLREAVPYVLGSSGTLMFDVSIFIQWLYYTGRLRIIGLHPSTHRHHHHHHHRHSRHYHPRQHRSRTHSRVESMVLSPSGSQPGGLYSILVNEDESTLDTSVNQVVPSTTMASYQQSEPVNDRQESEERTHSLSH
ncbi:hypothetical protein BX616_002177, partial [Lobosporangium transversale]